MKASVEPSRSKANRMRRLHLEEAVRILKSSPVSGRKGSLLVDARLGIAACRTGDPYLSVTVPAYNEAERLPRTLRDLISISARQVSPTLDRTGWVISLYSFSLFLVFGIPNAASKAFRAEVAVRIFPETKIADGDLISRCWP